MMQPFPTTPDARKKAHASMVAVATDLMSEVAALRALFPKSKMVSFIAPGVEFGEQQKNGWVVPADVDRIATRKAAQIEIAASNARAKNAHSRRRK